MSRTPEQRAAAKIRRDKRKARKQEQIGSYDRTEDTTTSRHSQIAQPIQLLTQNQIIQEIRRLPVAERYWDEDFTFEQKRAVMTRVEAKIMDEQEDQLSTIIFDAIYYIRDNDETFKRGSGLVAPSEDIKQSKKERREQRKLRRENDQNSNNLKYHSKNSAANIIPEINTKNQNNPLQEQKDMVNLKYGNKQAVNQKPRGSKSNGENTMILVNEKTNTTLRLKIRTKGAPKYAESGDNRPATIDGTKVNLVLNPKTENNTSKRVGLDWGGKWYFVDDANAHTFVKGLSPKATTAFTQQKREAKAAEEKPAKAAKATATKETKEKPATKAKAKSKKVEAAAE